MSDPVLRPAPLPPAPLLPARAAGLVAAAGDLGLLALLLAVAAALTGAMILQLGFGEVPCPLCLLQRVAMFGICFGLMHHFRPGDRVRGVGLALVAAVFLLAVSARQTLIDIYPRPGHAYVGGAVLGLHLPVWSVLIALAAITALAVQLAVVGAGVVGEGVVGAGRGDAPAPRTARVAGWAGLYVSALCALNLGAVFLQCGLGACHTGGYRLLP